MKIGVISDTHGNITAFRRALELFRDADIIVHAGDVLYHPPRLCCQDGYDIPAFAEALNTSPIPIVIAWGNCDAEVYEELVKLPVQSPYAVAELNGIRIVVTHGHLLSRDGMIDLGRRYKANYFVSGHTHIPVIDNLGDLILMNPGSPAFPKLEIDGKLIPTVGIITDTAAQIINIDSKDAIAECRMRTAE